jgi:hypothetical protein
MGSSELTISANIFLWKAVEVVITSMQKVISGDIAATELHDKGGIVSLKRSVWY